MISIQCMSWSWNQDTSGSTASSKIPTEPIKTNQVFVMNLLVRLLVTRCKFQKQYGKLTLLVIDNQRFGIGTLTTAGFQSWIYWPRFKGDRINCFELRSHRHASQMPRHSSRNGATQEHARYIGSEEHNAGNPVITITCRWRQSEWLRL